MSEKPEALWVAEQRQNDGVVLARRLFRTRDAGRRYVNDHKPGRHTRWTGPFRATWGPEQ